MMKQEYSRNFQNRISLLATLFPSACLPKHPRRRRGRHSTCLSSASSNTRSIATHGCALQGRVDTTSRHEAEVAHHATCCCTWDASVSVCQCCKAHDRVTSGRSNSAESESVDDWDSDSGRSAQDDAVGDVHCCLVRMLGDPGRDGV
jgi:hypothetical protein